LEEIKDFKDKCQKSYSEALKMLEIVRDKRINEDKKDVIDPIRLALNLNYALFLFEIENNKK
jgi:hypothetical protein